MKKSVTDLRGVVRAGYEIIDYASAFARGRDLRHPVERYFLTQLANRLPRGARVIDLGCGTGLPYDAFLAGAGLSVTGVDFTRKHLDAARRNVPGAMFVEADLATLPLADASADAIVSFYAIFHIPRDEHAALFAKIRRALRRGGLLLVTLGTSDSLHGVDDDWFGAPMAWSTFDPPTYLKLLGDAGFEILESRFEGAPSDDEYHLWVLAQSAAAAAATATT